MNGRTFVLRDAAVRARCAAWIRDEAPADWVVRGSPQAKKRLQEEKYHAMVNDVALQTTYAGKQWDREDMKRILVDEFAEEMRQLGTPLHHDTDGRLIPSENGRRIIQLGIQTREFWVSEASDFIEFLYAWGGARNVVWSDEARMPLPAPRRSAGKGTREVEPA